MLPGKASGEEEENQAWFVVGTGGSCHTELWGSGSAS